jgi:hypothetical protein
MRDNGTTFLVASFSTLPAFHPLLHVYFFPIGVSICRCIKCFNPYSCLFCLLFTQVGILRQSLRLGSRLGWLIGLVIAARWQ